MDDLLIGLVGPCAAGKTTIGGRLKTLGFRVRQIAQEHSYVPHMWLHITNPDFLVFLDVTYENTLVRRNLRWRRDEYDEQLRRLEHARQHADLRIDTNHLTPDQVMDLILSALKSAGYTLNG